MSIPPLSKRGFVMNVILYNISETPEKINKKLGEGTIIENVRFLHSDTLNVKNPTILLNISELIDIVSYNYCYIPTFEVEDPFARQRPNKFDSALACSFFDERSDPVVMSQGTG